MPSSSLKAKIVCVQRERGKTGLFYATSKDLKGLLVSEPTLKDLDREIPHAIREMYLACGMSVVVTRADARADHLKAWVALPAKAAKRALADAGL